MRALPLAAFGLSLALPALTLAQSPAVPTPAPSSPTSPAPAPMSPGTPTRPDARRAEIDNLLAALKAAPTEEAAAALETRIEQLWLGAGSPAATLLLGRGQRDLSNDAAGDAVDDFDAALALEPELPAAFERRAVARFGAGDYAGAVRDIQAALAREPRSFMALQSLSRIAEGRGDLRGALLAWRKVLELDPKTPGGDKRLRELTRKVEGEAT